MKKTEYRLIPHTADICIEVTAKTLRDLYLTSAHALIDQMIIVKKGGKTVMHHITVNAIDRNALLVNWLQEILYNFYVGGLIYNGAAIKKLTTKKLTAETTFFKFDPGIHSLKQEIKAVTYHNLNITRKKTWFAVRVIFDV